MHVEDDGRGEAESTKGDQAPAPKSTWFDRPSARTADEREAVFQQYLTSSAPYNAAIEADGDTPWHGGDVDRRRELFNRRYQRPEPPASIPLKTLAEIRGDRRG